MKTNKISTEKMKVGGYYMFEKQFIPRVIKLPGDGNFRGNELVDVGGMQERAREVSIGPEVVFGVTANHIEQPEIFCQTFGNNRVYFLLPRDIGIAIEDVTEMVRVRRKKK